MLLKEFIAPFKLTKTGFARHLNWPYSRLHKIINGKQRITAGSALDLGEALQTGPEFWLNLQRDWDLWHGEKKHRHIQPLPGIKEHLATV
jgi:addiction module HigA family antidote